MGGSYVYLSRRKMLSSIRQASAASAPSTALISAAPSTSAEPPFASPRIFASTSSTCLLMLFASPQDIHVALPGEYRVRDVLAVFPQQVLYVDLAPVRLVVLARERAVQLELALELPPRTAATRPCTGSPRFHAAAVRTVRCGPSPQARRARSSRLTARASATRSCTNPRKGATPYTSQLEWKDKCRGQTSGEKFTHGAGTNHNDRGSLGWWEA